MKRRRILITGGSGFLGTNLVQNYIDHDWQVLNIDKVSPRNAKHNPNWCAVDILDRHILIKKIMEFQPDVLLHFAARTDLEEKSNLDGYAANIDGVCHVIEAIRFSKSVERVIFASSQLVCKLGYQPKNEYDYCPTTLYGRSKVLTEKVIHAAHDIGAVWTIVRPTSLWGPWFDVPYRNFFEAIQKGLYIHPRNVTVHKQWGFVGNSVYQVQNLLCAPIESVHGKTFYLADYDPLDLCQFANLVSERFGNGVIRQVPLEIMKIIARTGDVLAGLGWQSTPLTSFRLGNILAHEVQDLAPLEAITGKLPFRVEEGITRTIDWMQSSIGGFSSQAVPTT